MVRPRGTSCFPPQAVRIGNTKFCGLLNDLLEVPPITGSAAGGAELFGSPRIDEFNAHPAKSFSFLVARRASWVRQIAAI